MKRTNVMQEEWDYLIVLDACRYDYFERVWRKFFLQGRLEKIFSVGSGTVEWRDNSFTEFYEDVVFVSSTPYINSVKAIKGFCGGDYFFKVYDVWKSGWNQKLGTVRPEKVTEAGIKALRDHPDKRMVFHYLQPHAPYVTLDDEFQGFPVPDMMKEDALGMVDHNVGEPILKLKILKNLVPRLSKTNILGDRPEWFLRQFLGMSPRTPMDAVRRKLGRDGLRKAYAANLEIALVQVVRLCEHLSGKIVITADHGEHLGENRCYTHKVGSTSKYLLEVPWMVMEKEGRDVPAKSESAIAIESSLQAESDGPFDDDKEIEARLRALGYFD